MNNKQRKYVRLQVKAMDKEIMDATASDGQPFDTLEELDKALVKWRTLADPVEFVYLAKDANQILIDAIAIVYGALTVHTSYTYKGVEMRESDHLPAGYIMIHTKYHIHIINLAAASKNISIERNNLLGRFIR